MSGSLDPMTSQGPPRRLTDVRPDAASIILLYLVSHLTFLEHGDFQSVAMTSLESIHPLHSA